MLEGGGVVLDLGCGSASSSIAMAARFPRTKVHAVDCDAASMERARSNIREAEESGEVARGQVSRPSIQDVLVLRVSMFLKIWL